MFSVLTHNVSVTVPGLLCDICGVISTLSLSILCNQLNAMLHHAIAESVPGASVIDSVRLRATLMA